jgi:hypothetical protein
VYYIDAQQGFYYAILTSKTIRAFYLDSSGNTIYVSVYRWDLNTSWIIFQAPLSTRIYLREESYSMSTFATPSNWFSGNPAPATPHYNITVSFPQQWGGTNFATIYPQNSAVSIARWFDGSMVVVRNTTTYSFNTGYSLTFQADIINTYVTTGTTYTASISLTTANNPPSVTLQANASGLAGYEKAGIGVGGAYCAGFHAVNNVWITSASWSFNSEYPIWNLAYSAASLTYSTSGSTSVAITTSSSTTTHNDYACYNFRIINRYIVNINLILSQSSVSFSADKQYIQSNNIITTDTNNKIYIAGALETLPHASILGASSSSTYYVYSRSVTISSSTRQDWTKPIVLIYDSSGGSTTLSISNTTIQPGDAIAPHLFMWRFNGVDGYIQTPYMSTFNQNPFTVLTSIWQDVIKSGDNPVFVTCDSFVQGRCLHIVIRYGHPHLGFYADDLSSGTLLQANTWYFLGFAWEGPTTKKQLIYVDAALHSTRTSSGLLTVTTGSATGNGGTIGRSFWTYFQGYIAQMLIYSRALSSTEIYNAYAYNIISSSNLILFLDPTFYNGTHYIDLSPYGNHGTPYGGVSRFVDSRQWLYLIKNRYSDGLLHLQWFPGGSRIYLYSGNNLVASYTIPGSPSQQVADYAVSIPSGYTIDRVLAYIPMQSSQAQADYQVVRSPNPAAVIYSPVSGVAPAWLFNYGSSVTVAVINPPNIYNNSQITLDLVYTYPIRYTKPTLDVLVAQGGDLVSLFPISGSIQANPSHISINGSIDLSSYVGSTVILSLDGSYSITGQAVTGYIGSYLAVYPQASGVMLTGTFNISVAVILYNIATMMNYTYAIDTMQLKQITADKIQYVISGQITGSWQYRIPISINLMELPTSFQETGFLFRLILPTQTWINNGLLCPNLEDLIMVDGSGRPLAFYLFRQGATSVVYVRYDSIITTTQIVIYVLLKNQALCGTGNSFSTLSAFDAVDPRDFTDDFGYNVYFNYFSWNLLVFIPQAADASLKAGSSFYDAVELNATSVWARHGSLITWQQSLNQSIWSVGDEIIAVIARPNFDSLLIYRNGEPIFAIDLKNVDASPGQYLGYKGAKVYAGKMLMYSYSIGQIVGGFSMPKMIGPEQPRSSSGGEANWWWAVIGALIPLIVIAVIFRLIENPPISGRGGRGGGGGLPW